MFETKEITGECLAPHIFDITWAVRQEDERYALAVAQKPFADALLDSCEASDRLFAVVEDTVTVALAGVRYAEDRAYLWVQTSSLTDGRSTSVVKAARKVIQSATENFPFPLGVIYRADDERLTLLAAACRFIDHTIIEDYAESGIPHQLAWRY